MTAPRFTCRNTKKALAERGPSIHDGASLLRRIFNAIRLDLCLELVEGGCRLREIDAIFPFRQPRENSQVDIRRVVDHVRVIVQIVSHFVGGSEVRIIIAASSSWPGLAVRRTASLTLAYARPSMSFASKKGRRGCSGQARA
jgi:hypothetical protein